MRSQIVIAFAAATLSSALLAGCGMQVSEMENSEGGKNVSINTPMGGMDVKTDKVEAKDTGLPVYPGARILPREENNEQKANVKIETPWFGLKVVALGYESDDPPEKIWDFYKKEMAKYGRVLGCKPGSTDLDIKKKDKDDLTCQENDDDKHHFQIHDGDMELKVGTESRQRVVGIKPKGKVTQFHLVYVVTRGTDDSI